MGLRIQNNVEAFNAHRQLSVTGSKQSKAMEKLASGFRINRAADDAAGLAISEKMRGQIGGLDQAQRNAQDGISLVQTAEGSLNEVHSMLQRIRDLKVQYGNGSLSADDKVAVVNEAKQLSKEIYDIGKKTAFNTNPLLDGGAGLTFQVGANDGETVSTNTVDLKSSTTGAGKLVAIAYSDLTTTPPTATTVGTAAATDDSKRFADLTLADIDDAIKN